MRSLPIAMILTAILLTSYGTMMRSNAEAVEHYGYKVNDAGLHGGSYTECLKCHGRAIDNRTIAKGIPDCMPVCFFGKNHPLNKDYPPPKKEKHFKPVRAAEQGGIKFVDGKIDCISCHNLMENNLKLLRVEYKQKLCQTCHVK